MLIYVCVLIYVCCDNGYMYMIHFWQYCDMAMQGSMEIFLCFMQGSTRTLRVPWKYFYTLCRGEQEHLTCYISICYNLFTTGGVSLQGKFSYTQVVIIKNGENVEAYKIERFWWWITKWYRYIWSSISSLYIEFWLLKLLLKLWLFMCIF